MDRSRPRTAVAAVFLVMAAATVWLSGTAGAQAAAAPTVVTLTFDDGDADQFSAQQTMAAHDLVGTFYVTTGWIDKPGHLTREQLGSIAEGGNEIGGHTVNHPDLTQIPLPEAQAEICNSRAVLESWGFRPTNFSYPFMRATPEVEQVAAQCGYHTSRGLGDIVSPYSCRECPYAESMPPAEPQYLKAPAQVVSSWTLDDLKAIVTNAAGGDGGWVILTFHHICAPLGLGPCPPDPSIHPDTFAAFAAWLDAFRDDAANNTVVQTVDETVRQYLGSSFPGPQPLRQTTPRSAVPPGLNALENPSVETTDPQTGFPYCWQPGGWGDNTTEWATVSPGRSGSTAQQVRITRHEDGDAKVMPTNDVHTCAPTVSPGKTYELSVWYLSTGRSQFALYLRNESYQWTTWMSGPWVEASTTPTTWTHATFVTPPVPDGVTALSFGLALTTEGTLTTDDYGLVETEPQATLAVTTSSKANPPPSSLTSPFTWMLAAVALLMIAIFHPRFD